MSSNEKVVVYVLANSLSEYNLCVNRCVAAQEDFLTGYLPVHCSDANTLIKALSNEAGIVVDGRLDSVILDNNCVLADIV